MEVIYLMKICLNVLKFSVQSYLMVKTNVNIIVSMMAELIMPMLHPIWNERIHFQILHVTIILLLHIRYYLSY